MPASIAWLVFIPLALLFATPPAQRIFGWIGRVFDRVARLPMGAEGVVFLVGAVAGAIPMLLDAVPPPSTHDEFAYLLAADTFMHGRLANPPHELWEHFETFHQIMQPTYASKFPPGQGLALAAGMLLGRPIIGAWGTIALACAALCWMLRAALPPRWALAGGLLAAMHPLLLWWGQIYWGGGVALLGGTLLLGATLRAAMNAPAMRWGIIAGIGIAILANSRPFEGALVTAMLLTVAAMRAISRRTVRPMLTTFALPIVLVLLPVGAWMMYYNWRVTHSAVTMPYVVHARQYMMSPLLWLERPPLRPEYRHAKLAHYYELHEYREYSDQRTFDGFLRGAGQKTFTLLSDVFAPPTLAVGLLGLGAALRRQRVTRMLLLLCLVFPIAHFLLTPWFRIQYVAPMLPLVVLLLMLSIQQIRPWRSGRASIGGGLVGAIFLMQVLAIAWMIDQMARNPAPTGAARARLVEERMNLPGRHLILVYYAPGPQSLFEWVYNDADIDGSKIVFARSIDDERDQQLLEYFADRRVWLLRVDGHRYEIAELRR